MSTYVIGGRLVAGGGLEAGQITVRKLLPVAVDAELVLNDAESFSAKIKLPLRDPETGVVIDLPNQLVPGRDFIGIVANGVLLAAGPLWGDPFTYPYEDRLVGGGLWSYFDHRYVLPRLEGRLPRDVTTRWTNTSLRTIAKRLVQQACSHDDAGLPIDYEPDFDGDQEREYPGSEGKKVGDALRDLTNVEGGPDIAFRPYITTDRRFVRWSMVTGDPELTQPGEDWYWDVSAPTPHATIRNLDRDGRSLHSRRIVTGATVRNLIEDGSFEDGKLPWSPGVNCSGVSLSDPSWGAAHGQLYMRVTATAAGEFWALYGDDATRPRTVPATPGSVWAAQAVIRGDDLTSGRVVLRFLDSAGAELLWAPGVAIDPSSSWQQASVMAVAPNGTASVHVVFAFVATAAGQAAGVDMVSLTNSTELPPFAVDEVELQAVAESDLLTDASFPLLEDWDDRSSVLRTTTLQAYAEEGVLRGSAHIEGRAIIAKRNATPALGTYLPGDYARVRTAATARTAAETTRERITHVSFHAEGDVTIETAPQRVVSGYPVPASNRRWLANTLAALERRITEANRGG